MFRLYVDESGKNSLVGIVQYAPHFSVAGVLVHPNHGSFVKRRADQIKFKYWGKTQVTFRANDMRRLTGDFSVFAGKSALFTEFCDDFKEYLRCSNFHLMWVGVNKINYLNNNPPIKYVVDHGWKKQIVTQEKKLTQKLFCELWHTYLCYLASKKNSRGSVIIEAADKTQDGDILVAYNYIMQAGIPSMRLSGADVRKKLTALSFVTKNNLDAETQIADIGAHFLTLESRISESVGYGGITQFDKDIIALLKSKLFDAKCNGGKRNSCQIL